MRWGLAVAIAAGLACSVVPPSSWGQSSPDTAHSRPLTADELVAYVVGVEYWRARGRNPERGCRGRVRARVIAAPPDHSYIGLSSGCVIEIVDTLAAGPFMDFCIVVVHELGHEAGVPHSTDPLDVMHPEGIVPLAECEDVAVEATLDRVAIRWGEETLRQIERCDRARQRVRRLRARGGPAAKLRRASRRHVDCRVHLRALRRRYAALGWSIG